jgi:hypothetical protein
VTVATPEKIPAGVKVRSQTAPEPAMVAVPAVVGETEMTVAAVKGPPAVLLMRTVTG